MTTPARLPTVYRSNPALNIKQAQIEIIDGIATSVSSRDLSVHASVLHQGPVSEAIIAKAVDCDPVFIVKGTPYHSPADQATFTFTDWRLLLTRCIAVSNNQAVSD